jgi:ATP-dependent DNA helicase 2 subunit 1
MHKAAGEFMREWNEAIAADERCVATTTKGTKRNIVEVEEDDLADVHGAWENRTLEKVGFHDEDRADGQLKVQELRDYAKFKST